MSAGAESSTFAGLALWLVPTLDWQREILQHEMDALRLANADIASAPFPPHVTLIAGIPEQQQSSEEVWEAFQQGLEQWRSIGSSGEGSELECPLEDVTTRGIYFQDQPDYFPHCSLLYAPLTAEEASEQIEGMQRRNAWERQAAGSSLAFGGGTGSNRMTDITLGRVELWDCNGPVERWKCLEGMKL